MKSLTFRYQRYLATSICHYLMRGTLVLASVILLQFNALAQGKNQEKYQVKFKSGNYLPGEHYKTKANNSKRKQSQSTQKQYVLIQFYDLPGKPQLANIKSAGIELLEYIPHNAYWASLNKELNQGQLKALGIRSVEPIQPEHKIDPELIGSEFPEWAVKESGKVDVKISFFKNYPLVELKSALQSNGAQILKEAANYSFIEARVPQKAIYPIAQIEGVSYIAPISPDPVPENYFSVKASRANTVRTGNNPNSNVTGKGITIAVGDVFSPHIHADVQNRVVRFASLGSDWHGDHTSGTLAGNGNLNPLHTGIAPEASMVFTEMEDNIDNAPMYYTNNHVRITSNSYMKRGRSSGLYNVHSQIVDIQAGSGNFPDLLHVFAAANTGPFFKSIADGWAVAKNTITVGNITSNYEAAFNSARGPVIDGRIKPEVVALGSDVVSSIAYNTYRPASGTSMATPAVAGAATLIYERYKQLNNDANPDAALVKALLCNTAEDLGNPGPDFTYGFGVINVRRAIESLEKKQYFTGTVNAGDSITHSINVPSGTRLLKVMLYWKDKAPALAASIALVNDLDLTVKQGGNVFHPWVLDPTPGRENNVAVRGKDRLNNIEQVTIDNPVSGAYALTVNGKNIASGSEDYVIVYEIIQNSLVLTYPSAGESFAPGETIAITWDEFTNGPFSVSYSTNNGGSWTTINSSIPAGSKFLHWQIPNTITGELLVKISNGSTESISSGPSSIMGIATNLSVNYPSSNQIQLNWSAVQGASSYDVYVLRPTDKEIQLVGNTASTSYTFTGIQITENWVSVRAKNAQGAVGRRAMAARTLEGGMIHVNLAKGKPAVASSVENASFPASNAFDDSFNTRWSSQFSDPQWIYVDLGKTYNIQKVRIHWEAAYARNFQIQVSDDATNWTTIHSVTGNDRTFSQLDDLSGSGRYVRMLGTARAIQAGYSIYEMQVHGSDVENNPPMVRLTSPNYRDLFTAPATINITAEASDSDGHITKVEFYSNDNKLAEATSAPYTYTWSNVPTGNYLIKAVAYDNMGASNFAISDVSVLPGNNFNLALNKPAVASSSENHSFPASNAFDGNFGSRWSSTFSNNQWIYVDLQKVYDINQVKITWEAAYGRDYDIQVSNDAVNWSNIREVRGNTSLVNDWTGITGTGRYVRMFGITRAIQAGFSIFEMEVYGAENTNTPPSVHIAYPFQHATYSSPASFTIQANANDSDGHVTKVEFFANGNKLGESTTVPYNFTWSNMPTGNYTLTARAFDNQGAFTTSSGVSVHVMGSTNPNLAVNKPSVASSVESHSFPASNAFDNNLGTRWSSQFSDHQWIYVDLQGVYDINRVKITWEAAYGRDYQIQASNDAATWTTIRSVSNNTTLINDLNVAGRGRYVRMLGTRRAISAGYSIFEMEVYGTEVANTPPNVSLTSPTHRSAFTAPATVHIVAEASDSDGFITKVEFFNHSTKLGEATSAPYTFTWSNVPEGDYRITAIAYDNGGASRTSVHSNVSVIRNHTPNLALNKPSVASSLENSAFPASHAFDANFGTRWSSQFSDPQWIYVDLQAVYDINRVKITWEAAYGRDYQIQVSNNAANWTTIRSVNNNTSLVNDLNVTGRGRYVRMLGTRRGIAAGYSIFEMEVYGISVTNSMSTARQMTEETILDNPVTQEEVIVYPNPAKEVVKVAYANTENQYIKLYISDLKGTIVYSSESYVLEGNQEHNIALDKLGNGVYVLHLTKDGKHIVKRISIVK
jgi:hypothetical protein